MKKGRQTTGETRPRKSPGARRRRISEHRKRALALGIPEDQVRTMTTRDLREALRCPEKTRARYAS